MPVTFTPTVHRNGTSRDALQNQFRAAYDAVTTAKHALQEAAPHARDYYVQGETAYASAVREHVYRLERLEQVQIELALLWESVAD